MTDFLLELRSEEIPARMQDDARANLKRLFEVELAKAGLKADDIATYATPRRLALIAYGLPLETEAVSEERKGPRADAPDAALQGFLRSTGLKQEDLVSREDAKGAKVYFAVIEKAGRKTADVLAEAIPAIIRGFPWPKSMRWGTASQSTESLRWVRPLQGIVALLGDDVVACEVDGIISGSTTMGHRFHHRGPITIDNAGSYAEKLRAGHVILDQEKRRAIIRAGAEKAATDAGLVLVPDAGLVTENAGLTEWPVPMLGRFDPAFLAVPEEVIQLTARVNQKYFICRDGEGRLANAFICTANIVARDGGAAIVAGNEKVLAARLSDAKFFYEQDLKVPLEEHAAKLSSIVFHEKLGTVADKVERVAKLARWLVESGVVKSSPSTCDGEGNRSKDGGGASSLRPATPPSSLRDATSPSPFDKLRIDGEELADMAERAARLCKADLVTGMVGEFPELQGMMGGYYARAQGEGDAVADAIRDHYKPVGQGDYVPTAPVTVAVSLADKLDTLCEFFLIDEAPTGSKDPFALRRAALSIISLILNNDLRFRMEHVLLKVVEDDLAKFGMVWEGNLETKLAVFFADRLKVQQREAGVRHDLIDAVFALGGEDDLVRLLARVKALQAFITTDEGENLLAAYKRTANILKSSPSTLSSSKGDGEGDHPQDGGGASAPLRAAPPSSLRDASSPSQVDGEEFALKRALDAAEPLATAAIEREDFEAAMTALASLRAPIDAFFDGVMVNDPDPHKRAYRIGLLTRFRDAVHRVADFSKIEG